MEEEEDAQVEPLPLHTPAALTPPYRPPYLLILIPSPAQGTIVISFTPEIGLHGDSTSTQIPNGLLWRTGFDFFHLSLVEGNLGTQSF